MIGASDYHKGAARVERSSCSAEVPGPDKSRPVFTRQSPIPRIFQHEIQRFLSNHIFMHQSHIRYDRKRWLVFGAGLMAPPSAGPQVSRKAGAWRRAVGDVASSGDLATTWSSDGENSGMLFPPRS